MGFYQYKNIKLKSGSKKRALKTLEINGHKTTLTRLKEITKEEFEVKSKPLKLTAEQKLANFGLTKKDLKKLLK